MKTMFDYAAILATLREIAPAAHIAGGAVRDSILQKSIQDIDVFMSEEHVEQAAARLRFACSYVKVGEWKQYLGLSDPAMTCVAKFEKADEALPICIIGLRPEFARPEANIARFDFGICMAAFDGQHTIRTPQFDQDVEAHAFTLCRADNLAQFTYSLSRFEKITAGRYAGWQLVVPPEFEGLAKEHDHRRHWYQDYQTGEWCPKGSEMGKNLLKPKERMAAHQ